MKKRFFIVLSVLFAVLMLTSLPVMAASKAKEARKAYVSAIENGQVDVYAGSSSAVEDADGDGVPELMIFNEKGGPQIDIYAYKGGKVVRVVSHDCEYTMYYNAAKKTFHEVGEGDGGWRIDYKLKGDGLKELRKYYGYKHGEEQHATKTVNGKEKEISYKLYKKAMNNASKGNALKKRTKKALIKYLKK